MKTLFVSAAASTVMLTALAGAVPDVARSPVPNIRPLLLSALEAEDGRAHGLLVGEMADFITQHFKATSPIYVDVRTAKRYTQPGCARLLLNFWQEGVQLANGANPNKKEVEFGLDYCMDGLPPRSKSSQP